MSKEISKPALIDLNNVTSDAVLKSSANVLNMLVRGEMNPMAAVAFAKVSRSMTLIASAQTRQRSQSGSSDTVTYLKSDVISEQ